MNVMHAKPSQQTALTGPRTPSDTPFPSTTAWFGGVIGWGRGITATFLLVVVLAGSVSWIGKTAAAQDKGAAVELAPEVKQLLNGDIQKQWDSLEALRQDLQSARHVLLAALESEEPEPNRWRAVHHLTEFGAMEDVPTLLGLLKDNGDAWERKVISGTVRALYEAVGSPVDLGGLVMEFSFVQTRSARRLPDQQDGLFMLSNWSFTRLHRSDIDYAVVKRLMALRRKGYESLEGLQEGMQKRLTKRQWREYRERLPGFVERIPSRAMLDGLARVRLSNPLDRPLLMEVSLGVWFGRLDEPVPPYFVYLKPGGESGVDIPIKPVGDLTRDSMRLDLRLREVNGPVIPAFSKVYLPLRP